MIAIEFLRNIWFAPVFALVIGLLKHYTKCIPDSRIELLEDPSGGSIWVRDVDGRLTRL
jgi:hypothetical protein